MTNFRTRTILDILQSRPGTNNLREEEDSLLEIMGYLTPFHFGWANYENTGDPQAVSAGTWTNLENNRAGGLTQEDRLPKGVRTLMNPNGSFNLDTVQCGSIILFRFDVQVVTENNNCEIDIRTQAGSAPQFELGFGGPTQPKAAGSYDIAGTGIFFVGTQDLIEHPPHLQIWAEYDCTVFNRGSLIAVFDL